MAGRWAQASGDESFLRQAVPVLLVLAVGSLVTGVVFERMTPLLRSFPGLIVLVPPLIGLRGNINTAMGARLSSGMHLGVIDPSDPWHPEVRENVAGSLVLSTVMPALAGILAWAASIVLGLDAMALGTFVLVATVAGLLSGLFLAGVTLVILAAAHRYGIDPDNVTGPALATVGDVVTLAILYGTAVGIAGGFP
jgi:mgtE-like transporter